jgi:polysaccharide export outer membrane protein
MLAFDKFRMAVIACCLFSMCVHAQTSTHDPSSEQAVRSSTRDLSASGKIRTDGSLAEGIYRIGADDLLSINVWHEADLSRNVPVRPDGRISVPLVGDIQAAGKTALELQDDLTLAFSKFVKMPEVTVIVSDIRSRRVNVIGQVTRPGTYSLTHSMGVLDALAEAGGLRDFAKKKSIYVLRVMPDGTRRRLPYSYLDVLKGGRESLELILQPHDTVVVP